MLLGILHQIVHFAAVAGRKHHALADSRIRRFFHKIDLSIIGKRNAIPDILIRVFVVNSNISKFHHDLFCIL